ncbi:MAG: hypothetical protein H6741_05335 [Alphaproteobacteria bacterium]|nr:hypothetical protein [Alphaproteobacteria bacterium]MCB9792129.1 hypothetical protein [Alphaproteobacteria bacterium]
MWIRAISVEGLSGLHQLDAQALGRVVRVGGPPRAQGALFEALTLALGAFSPQDAERAVARLGQGLEAQVSGAPLPEAISLGRPQRLGARLDPEGERTLKVHLELELDPPQFGLIREHARRSPELASALGEDAATLRLSLGWAFTTDLSLASLSVFGVRLGDVVPAPGTPAAWRDALLRTFAGRGRGRDPLELSVQRIAEAERAPERARRQGVARLREALQAPPFSLPRLELVDAGDGAPWLALGEDLAPLEAHGPGSVDAVGLAEAVFIDPSEILALRSPGALSEDPEAVREWLSALVDAEDSPLEQLWLFNVPGPHDLVVTDRLPPGRGGGLRFPGGRG